MALLKTIAEGRAVLELGMRDAGVWMPPETLDLVHGLALFESNQGDGWKGAGAGSHNWGAVHAGEKPPCKPGHFEQYDDGPSCFVTYPSDRAGAAGLVRVLWRMPHVRAYLAGGGIEPNRMAAEMKRDRYFTSDLAGYQQSLSAKVKRVREALGRREEGPMVAAGIAFVVGWAALVGVVVYRSK